MKEFWEKLKSLQILMKLILTITPGGNSDTMAFIV